MNMYSQQDETNPYKYRGYTSKICSKKDNLDKQLTARSLEVVVWFEESDLQKIYA